MAGARLREVARLTFGGSTGLARTLEEADQGLRRAVSTSRRVAVVQADGGAGATTTLAGAATALAQRRPAAVLTVDAAAGAAALVAATRAPEPLPWTVARGATAGLARGADARAALPVGRGGLRVLGDGTASSPWPPGPRAWREAVDPVGRFFDVVLTDWGVRSAVDLGVVAGDHHVVAVVARADRGPAERGAVLAARLVTGAHDGFAPGRLGADGGPAAHGGASGVGGSAAGLASRDAEPVDGGWRAPAVVLVLVDVGGTAGRTDAVARDALDGLPVSVVAVPHDTMLGRGDLVAGTAVKAAWSGLASHLLARACDPSSALADGQVA
ncbi:hypothetical protein GXP71_16025 [Cellulomonas sp. H30R-01]|uniref:hypothetical protein n=1 Tax=Cellulomonas sp. H30R-01 TaxID=2704467 RepID=UPI00138CF5F4|nr:hypothetical protein [Cellulomonas sp. H30R-01]QHT57427.1 hypothetical protein GXP71_16025 [Cellulomonas sp. H30R-01]